MSPSPVKEMHFPKPRNGAGRNLKAAISTGAVLIALVLFAVFIVPAAWFPFVAVTIFAGTWEVQKRLHEHGYLIPLWLLLAAGQLMLWSAFFYDVLGLLAAFASSVLILMFSRLFIAGRTAKPQNYVRDTAIGIFVLTWIPLFGTFAALLSKMETAHSSGNAFVITFIMCVVASDTCGYIAGVMFGKHPLAPAVSPKKSIEGFVGSILGGMGVGILFVVWLLGEAWWIGALLGLGLVFCATLGDLVESQFKRELGIKDMSNLLPGHGGVLDRMDGMLPSAVATWLVLSLVSVV